MPDIEKPYRVTVGEFTFTFSQADIDALDLRRISPDLFHLIHHSRSLNGQFTPLTPDGKQAVVDMDGETYTVSIRDGLDQMLDRLGYSSQSTRQVKEIRAPMPGLVISLAVTEGQEVREGERILILEAMKMENSILIHADGRIKKIRVSPGQAVDKGQVLVDLE